MAKKQKKPLSALCTPERLTRCDYFSDTYSVVLSMKNGEKQLMDITHVSLPFKPNREAAVRKFFDLSDDEMDDLYKCLAQAVSNNVRTSVYLNRVRNTQSVVNILSVEAVEKKGRKGSDIYFVTEHLRPLVPTYFNGEATVKQIVNFGARFAKMVSDIHQSEDQSVTLRVPDVDQIYVADDGKYVFGCFQHAFNPRAGKPLVPVMPTMPMHIHPMVACGKAGNEGTDMYSIASMLWSLLNGDGFDKPTEQGAAPKYAPEALVPILRMGLSADPEMLAQFKKDLLNFDKQLRKPENNGDATVPIPEHRVCIEMPVAAMDIGIETEVEVPVDMADEPEVPIEMPSAEISDAPAEEVSHAETPLQDDGATGIIFDDEPEHEPETAEEAETLETAEDVELEEETPAIRKPRRRTKEEVFADFAVPMQTVKVLDTTEYVEETEPEAELEETEEEELIEFAVNYFMPRFFFDQLFIACAFVAVIAVVVYVSVSQHLISLW